MRVLVTGGAGFIGSHMADALLERGDEVSVVDVRSSGRLDERVDHHAVDVTDAAALDEVVRRVRPELIFHFAAQIDVRVSMTDPAEDARVNVAGTINVLQSAHGCGARVLFASTGGALYGRHAPIPSAEDLLPEPEAPYGTAKYCAEQYIALFERMHGGGHVVLRLANVYGPRQDPWGEAGVVAIFCGKVLDGAPPTVFGDGTQTRDYVYVGDVVDAFLAAADAGGPGVWNVGTGVESTVLDLIGLLGKAAGTVPEPVFEPARPGELQRSALDCGRIRADLGWAAAVPLEEGIGRVYRWTRDGGAARGPR